MASNNSLLLFKQEGQHIYDYGNVYDPDVDGADVANSGKIVPAVRSIVIDNRTSKWRVYLVSAVDPVTFKVTYVDFPYKTIDTNSIVLNYGNDFFMLYYDNRESDTITRLTVDSKMILFGANLASYRLVKDGAVISCYNKQGTNGINQAVSQVPINEVTNAYSEGIRRCDQCFTTVVLEDGDLVTLELYDSVGVLIGEVELVAKRATILNTLSEAANPITGFAAECNQTDGEDWYIYQGQPVKNLSIYPYVEFADQTRYVVPVDNSSCFIYGLEEVDSGNVGVEFRVLLKYYINDRYAVNTQNVITSGTMRVLYHEYKIKVVEKPPTSISKLSVLPIWRQDLGSYDLAFMAYKYNRSEPSLMTDKIVSIGTNSFMTFKSFIDTDGRSKSTLMPGITINGEEYPSDFDPALFNVEQSFSIKFVSAERGSLRSYHSQSFAIQLINPSALINDSRAVWLIEESADSTTEPYGSDNGVYNRPEIIWDEVAGKHFFDSTNKFKSVEEFLETFYWRADPPHLNTETEAPRPDKFRIKDINGNVLVESRPVSNYEQYFTIYRANTHNPVVGETASVDGRNVELPTIVILEFLLGSAVIYGVPVIIRNVPGSYRE